jgi:hypothetical protein
MPFFQSVIPRLSKTAIHTHKEVKDESSSQPKNAESLMLGKRGRNSDSSLQIMRVNREEHNHKIALIFRKLLS